MYVLEHLTQPEVEVDHRNKANKKAAMIEKPQKDVFEVKLDVKQFSPEDLSVKMVDNFLVVEGKHEEKEDEFGFISRQFTRRYEIPEDVKAEEITCNLSSDGFLVFSAPRIVEQPKPTERKLNINLTGRPATIDSTKSSEEPVTEETDKKSDKLKDVRVEINNDEPMAA